MAQEKLKTRVIGLYSPERKLKVGDKLLIEPSIPNNDYIGYWNVKPMEKTICIFTIKKIKK